MRGSKLSFRYRLPLHPSPADGEGSKDGSSSYFAYLPVSCGVMSG
jgi:hypothetical protein